MVSLRDRPRPGKDTLGDGPSPVGERRRVEIVHESLLLAWPRLVGWQTQDADGARVRDELRQASQVWDQHGRPDDLLWTGTTFREYRLWRERYPGGLTALEEAYAGAMTTLAHRRRRRRRLLTAAVVGLLALGLASFAALWRSSERARRSAEASKLLALGQLEVDRDPGAAFAYALASLEVRDGEPARMLALLALSRSPIPRVADNPLRHVTSSTFNPTGDTLVTADYGGLAFYARRGGPPRVVVDDRHTEELGNWPQVLPYDVDRFLLLVRRRSLIEIRSFSRGSVWRSFETGPRPYVMDRDGAIWIFASPIARSWDRGTVWRWARDASDPERVGSWHVEGLSWPEVDAPAQRLIFTRGRRIYGRPLRDPPAADDEVLVAEQSRELVDLFSDPWHPRVASVDNTGEVQLWALSGAAIRPLRVFPAPANRVRRILFDPAGAFLAVAYLDPSLPWHLWPLDGPEDARPLILHSRSPIEPSLADASFTPDGRWFAASLEGEGRAVHFFPVVSPHPITLRSAGVAAAWGMEFTGDGDTLLCGFRRGNLESWDLRTGRHRTIWEPTWPGGGGGGGFPGLAVDPLGESALASTGSIGEYAVALGDGSARRLDDLCVGECYSSDVALSTDAARAVFTISSGADREDLGIRLVDLPTFTVTLLEPSRGEMHLKPVFTPDGALYSARSLDGDDESPQSAIESWDLETGTRTEVVRVRLSGGRFKLSDDGRLLFALECQAETCTEFGDQRGKVVVRRFDLEHGTSRELESHGDRITNLAIDSRRQILATASSDGTVRVGSWDGDPPHLLLGHDTAVHALALDPTGRWIASGEATAPVVRLWPMPDLSEPPLHTLPYDRLLAKLRTITNIRAVADPHSPTGYKLGADPFPGWETVPEW